MQETQPPSSRRSILFGCTLIALGAIILLGGAFIFLFLGTSRHITIPANDPPTGDLIALFCMLVLPAGGGLVASGIWQIKKRRISSPSAHQ
jgi:hypothetical protein